MIRKILVSVDFTPGSAAALRYADALAATVGAETVRAIHVFTPQIATGDSLVAPDMGELMEERDGRLRRFIAQFNTPADHQREAELLVGFAADKIIDYGADFDLIVMGSSGERDLLEEVFGSVSTEVAQRAKCPVLLVPKQAKFRDYTHMLYASNSLSLSRRAVLRFRDFSELFHARVHFVHVNDEEGSHHGQRERLFAPLFSNPEPEFAFEINEVRADSVQDGLIDYLREHPIDLAVMVTKRRGFWEGLFHRSETRQMVLHPRVPMLVLHLED